MEGDRASRHIDVVVRIDAVVLCRIIAAENLHAASVNIDASIVVRSCRNSTKCNAAIVKRNTITIGGVQNRVRNLIVLVVGIVKINTISVFACCYCCVANLETFVIPLIVDIIETAPI